MHCRLINKIIINWDTLQEMGEEKPKRKFDCSYFIHSTNTECLVCARDRATSICDTWES